MARNRKLPTPERRKSAGQSIDEYQLHARLVARIHQATVIVLTPAQCYLLAGVIAASLSSSAPTTIIHLIPPRPPFATLDCSKVGRERRVRWVHGYSATDGTNIAAIFRRSPRTLIRLLRTLPSEPRGTFPRPVDGAIFAVARPQRLHGFDLSDPVVRLIAADYCEEHDDHEQAKLLRDELYIPSPITLVRKFACRVAHLVAAETA
ncbi:hypothetical protein AYO44_13305 [Planctomycetaceae bacterium SCGC AG-212-F19]|nr:hypothetical protein AYO44_13305 [Planctomycetaceae bacterium SCGC AG-212-F19]